MRASLTLIDKAKTLCQPPTDYKLAKQLGIATQTISRMRHKNGTLDNEAATKLAELLGQDPYDVIAVMELERAKTPEKKAFWERKLPRFLPLVAHVGIISGVSYVTSKAVLTSEVVRQLIHYAQWHTQMRMTRIFPRVFQA